MTLSCFERALALADDDNMADVWYNIGQVAIGIGDLNLAYQAFKIAISINSNHAESFNNLGVNNWNISFVSLFIVNIGLSLIIFCFSVCLF